MLHTYTLTGITGRAASDRRTITFATIDWKPRTLLVMAAAAVPALVVTLMAWSLVGPFGIIAGAGVVLGALWLFRTRSRTNSDLTRYHDMRDRVVSRKDIGKFFLAGREVDPTMAQSHVLRASTAPLEIG